MNPWHDVPLGNDIPHSFPVIIEVPKSFAGKEAELQELLILYRAGQISPEEYHKKRAEIVARP